MPDTELLDTAVMAVLDGMVDLHVHSGPNPFPREFDHVEGARDAQRLNMAGMLVKSHHHNTVMDLLAMREQLADVKTQVFGGIALNSQIGGLNPDAAAMSLRMGGRAVWFPTFSSRRHLEAHPEGGGFPTASFELPNRIVEVRNPDGSLRDEVYEVLDLVAESDALLSAGHLYPDQILDIFTQARTRQVRRMVISHPNFVIDADPAQCREFVALGAFVEHEVGQYDPHGNKKWDPASLLDWIHAVGPEHTVLASDLGQHGRPMPVEAFLRVGRLLLDLGLAEADLHRMTVTNPSFLIGLSPDRP